MATGRDTLRIVTLSAGGRPVQVLDLNDASGYFRDREAGFQFTPAAVSQQVSRRAQRFGGGRVVGEIHDNGSIGWTAYVRGSTVAECSQRAEALISQIHETARGRYLEWAPDTLSSSFLELAGPGSWTPFYDPLMLSQSQAMKVQISFPVLPLVRWAPMTIGDTFEIDSRSDYTFDASASADVSMSGSGAVSPVVGAALTAERRVRHTARGYALREGQATLWFVPGATITSYKSGVTLSASASTYVEVYVDDNGTNSRLRIDVVILGTRTNRASTNLGARVSNGTSGWVRGRIEGSIVIAEYFTSNPSPMSAPATTNTYTLVGAETSIAAGSAGWSWVPQHASAILNNFESQPYTWRNQTLPQLLAPLDAIPGTAPAVADVTVTPSGGAANPSWALIGWASSIDTSTSSFPLNVYEGESMTLFGWAPSAQAGSRGGNDARATTSGAGSFSATFSPQAIIYVEEDDFSDALIDIEVWARVVVSSTLVSPRIVASVQALSGVTVEKTVEYGTAGKLLTTPSSGTVYRFVRLGTLAVDSSATSPPLIVLAGSVGPGSTGAFGIDYVVTALARRRALGITGVAALTVPVFVPSTSEWIKRTNSDLSGGLAQPGGVTLTYRAHGLGGSLIEPSPGLNRWLVKLSNLVPDDPTSDATTEQLAHSATVSVDVTPRSFMLRSA
jgi:hypothetical protein